jgi:predicted chitinase
MSNLDKLIAVAPALNRADARQAIPAIVAECEKAGVTDRAQIAYVIATAQHETDFRNRAEDWHPNVDYRNGQKNPQKTYDNHDNSLGNKFNQSPNANFDNGDGYRFRGRGFVQVTGRDNYTKFSKILGIDLVGNPDAVLKPDIAARILVEGMRDGVFRKDPKTREKHSLDIFINDSKRDFTGAREIINGDKNKTGKYGPIPHGQGIAANAEKYYQVLRDLDLTNPNAIAVPDKKSAGSPADKASTLSRDNQALAHQHEFIQAAQAFLDKRGRIEGDAQVYRGDTYTFQKQADTLAVQRHGNEILKQVGDKTVVDKLTALDVKTLNTVNQYLDKLEQNTKDFANASQKILDQHGQSVNGSQVLKGNLYSFEKTGNTLIVQKHDQEIFKQEGNRVVHSQVTHQDTAMLNNVAQSLGQKEQNITQRITQHQEPVRAGM